MWHVKENPPDPGTAAIICSSACLTGIDQRVFSGTTSKSIILKPTNTITPVICISCMSCIGPLIVSTCPHFPTHSTSIGYLFFKIWTLMECDYYMWDIVAQRGASMLGNTLIVEP